MQALMWHPDRNPKRKRHPTNSAVDIDSTKQHAVAAGVPNYLALHLSPGPGKLSPLRFHYGMANKTDE